MSTTLQPAVRALGRTATVVIIGAGHAGLAMSRCLSERAIDHAVLERGEVANSWRHERWDSLRLLTPNWLCRLPGYRYGGEDPDGFMCVPEVIDFIAGYARDASAPVHTRTTVTAVERAADGYRVITDRGVWRCRALVVASGAFNLPVLPALAAGLPPGITSLHAQHYRNPDQLPEGGVLVVGASATGVQLADEIRRSGRPVTLAVGEHVRMPRLYRGRDIQWWMLRAGILDQRCDEVDDLERARRVPSPQLVGSPERATLDLNALADRGVELVGRLAGRRDAVLQFSGSLRNHCALADLKLARLLDGIDAFARARGWDGGNGWQRERFEPTRVDRLHKLMLDLRRGSVRTVVWATGYRPDYSWLRLPVLDVRGRIRHAGGVVIGTPGVYVMGLGFLRRRKSSFIHGAEDDARELSDHLASHLGACRGRVAVSVRGQAAARGG